MLLAVLFQILYCKKYNNLNVDFLLIHLLENKCQKRVLAQFMPYR